MDERRRYVRLDTRLKITYTILNKEKTDAQNSEAKDISGGGICIFLAEPLPSQTLLKLEISLLDDPPPITCVGKIIWVEEFSVIEGGRKEKNRYEAGIAFTEIDPKDQDRIIKYVILGYASYKK